MATCVYAHVCVRVRVYAYLVSVFSWKLRMGPCVIVLGDVDGEREYLAEDRGTYGAYLFLLFFTTWWPKAITWTLSHCVNICLMNPFSLVCPLILPLAQCCSQAKSSRYLRRTYNFD